jgi:hypothetical protein
MTDLLETDNGACSSAVNIKEEINLCLTVDRLNSVASDRILAVFDGKWFLRRYNVGRRLKIMDLACLSCASMA